MRKTLICRNLYFISFPINKISFINPILYNENTKNPVNPTILSKKQLFYAQILTSFINYHGIRFRHD